MKKEDILYEDASILVCEKPAGVPAQSDKTRDYDLVNQLKNYLFDKAPDKGVPYLAIVHRLDRPVGGIMVFAKNPQAAQKLSQAIQNRQIKKYYFAVINYEGNAKIGEKPELLTDYLTKDAKTNTSKITTKEDKNGKKAELLYEMLEEKEGLSLVRIELLTGRHHQIRVQLQKHFGGIWGDTKYNPMFQKKAEWSQIALYAYRLEFLHPKTGKPMVFERHPTQEPFSQFHI